MANGKTETVEADECARAIEAKILEELMRRWDSERHIDCDCMTCLPWTY